MSVLDLGYVRLINHMGSDKDVVNAARVSYDKEVDVIENKDAKLIEYLVKNKHDSVLRHCVMTFEVYAPLMVARQWYKHAVGSTHMDDQMGWNESSRRYITENERFYVPNAFSWRGAPENSKQGSSGAVDTNVGVKYMQKLRAAIERGMVNYEEALQDGIAPEQARLLLPAYAMYVRWRWTASLNAILHFASLRTASDAQQEIRDYANLVMKDVESCFPLTTKAWMEYR